jgi:hypothetical protein
VGQAIASTAAAYLRDIDRLDPRCYVSIRYEDLCAEPNTTMEKLFAFLETGAPGCDWGAQIRPRRLEPLPEAERVWKRTAPRLAAYLAHCRYGTWPGEFTGTPGAAG